MKHSLQTQVISTPNRVKRLHFDRMHALSLAFYVIENNLEQKYKKIKGNLLKQKKKPNI